MKKLIVVSFLFLLTINLLAQDKSAVNRILETFPNWRTNFNKSSIDLNELKSGGPPKDGIPAIINPKFVNIEEASDWLDENEPVIFLKYKNSVKGYPLQILIWHEIVNDYIEEMPVIVTFCPLCYSAIVFDRRLDELTLTFGVSGLLRNSDMVMYDLFTESFWQQFTGEAIVGTYTGEELKVVQSQIISFEQLIESYPEAEIMSQETGFSRRYGMNPYAGYDDIDQTPFLFDGKIDDRLPPNEKVIAIKEDGMTKAYPYTLTQELGVINDTINGNAITIFHSEGTASALDSRYIYDSKDVGSTGVFDPNVENVILTFEYIEEQFIDEQTNSVWDITGKAISGKLKGKQLKKISSGDYFAFAWLAFKPDTEIYTSSIILDD
ncbi:MAG: DUF3179 domain-containing protein [Melioribacteraceae bacterium]|nr:DUF3179 domain-containing protein [Melioribacteraceae bacterium]